MRWLRAGIPQLCLGVCLAAEGVCVAADTPTTPAVSPCSSLDPSGCQSSVKTSLKTSAKDRKTAQKAFERGLKLEQAQNLDEAFYEFEEAARLAPLNSEYLAAQEMTRQHLARMHLDRGNSDLAEGRQAEAVAEFRTALNLDPQNEFAQQRVLDAMGPAQMRTAGQAVVASADTLAVKPLDGLHDFHFRGDSRDLITAVASSYGLTVVFDEMFPSRRVRFDLEQADFATAMRAASAVTKSFCVALEETVLLAAVDNPENHKQYDRMGMRTFHITPSSPTELNELMNGLRILFEFRFASLDATASTITLRGPLGTLEAATQFLGQLDGAQPELLLDMQVLQVSHTYASNIGLHVPDQFNLFNIPTTAFAALGGQNVQDIINQLISSGGINQAGNQTIAALLAQLQGQQGSILNQRLATFGGGLTLMGLTLDQLAPVLSLNESSVKTLEHVTLRASQQKEATFKLGSRYPVLNASFAPISNSSAIAGVIGNKSYAAPFPSVSYEDIGLTLKAKPLIHRNSDVALEVKLEFRTLGSANVNGVPIISNREYNGGILLKDGEPAAIAGMITESDQRSLNGLPTFARIPGFGVLTSQHSHQMEDDELLIVMTPHVVRSPERTEAPEIWLSK